MSPSLWQILIIVVVVLILFGGRGKISSIMGDLGKGIRSFKKGMDDEEAAKLESSETKEKEDTK